MESAFVPDFEPEQSRTQRKTLFESKRQKSCVVCKESPKNIYNHAFKHIPPEFDHRRRQSPADVEVVVRFLLLMASHFRFVNVSAFFNFCQINGIIRSCRAHLRFTDIELGYFTCICTQLQVPFSVESLQAKTSVAILGHVIVLLHVVKTFPELIARLSSFHMQASRLGPPVLFDGRINLRSIRQNDQSKMTLADVAPTHPYAVSFVISTCEADCVPSLDKLRYVHGSDRRVFWSIGASPRMSDTLVAGIESLLDTCVCDHAVVAVGPFGLDFSEVHLTAQEQECQIDLSTAILGYFKASGCRKTLHVICQDKPSDDTAFVRFLDLCRSFACFAHHRFHFSDFLHGPDYARRWLDSFPNSSFGLSFTHLSNRVRSTALVKSLPLHSFVLESNAPHSGCSMTTLIDVARWVATIHDCQLRTVLSVTHEAGMRVFALSADGCC